MLTAVIVSLITVASSPPPAVVVDRDNIEITQTCTVKVTSPAIIDADNNGVVHIKAEGVVVDFAGHRLHGASAQQLPDSFAGIGIAITARNVTLRNANVSGYRVGIHAIGADGLAIHDCDVSNNFHQRLKSTPAAEDGSDWLWPHANDNNEWMTNYGAGLCVEDSSGATIHDIKARKTQNGIILDRVNDSKVYDCDCSFLSGWGLALWRSSRNVISRNAFDFCIRGYSHGVYNRGQDSAGILMFEQCCENSIVENSATHCGDGLFAFAGKEALGEVNTRDDTEWYKQRGCNNNDIRGNRFSFAAAHGLELTFSFRNSIQANTFVENAICGIWGGYSQETGITGCQFIRNGDMAYGLERGGINIEHGARNSITQCSFDSNRCGVALWWDEDPELAQLPWSAANGVASIDNDVRHSRFKTDDVAIDLRASRNTTLQQNDMIGVPTALDADDESLSTLIRPSGTDSGPCLSAPEPEPPGVTVPWNGRLHLAGRHNIIMTEWGPWDHESPLMRPVVTTGAEHRYELHKAKPIKNVDRDPAADPARDFQVTQESPEGPQVITVRMPRNGVSPYDITLRAGDREYRVTGVLTRSDWQVIVFPSRVDPRADLPGWHKQSISNTEAITVNLPELNLTYGHAGPSQLNLHKRVTEAAIPGDHFGTVASTNLAFPPGKWRIKTLSDDGIRVWLNQHLVIDDWTHHGPTEHSHQFTVDPPLPLMCEVRVEHFELDGYAVLSLDVEEVETAEKP